MFDFIVALLCVVAWLYHAREIRLLGHIQRLTSVKFIESFPRLSIVIPARNEEKTIRAALETVITTEYPNLEIIVVNDRSTDSTGTILDVFKEFHSNVKVVHIKSLPSGWLGKNHALHQGATHVSKDSKWILFTDADVHFQRMALKRAVSMAEQGSLDHLTILPRMDEHSHILGIVLLATLTAFMMFMKPWKVRSSAGYYAGIGPFNLVRASFYNQHGGHSMLKMRPDDDMMLGKHIKKSGGVSDYAFSNGEIHFSWYESVTELINGLSKNTYANLEYSLVVTAVAVILHLVMFIWPFFAVVTTTSGIIRLMSSVSILSMFGVAYFVSMNVRGSLVYAIGIPIGILVVVYILIRTVIVTHYQGGIVWRDTLYHLKELKANVV